MKNNNILKNLNWMYVLVFIIALIISIMIKKIIYRKSPSNLKISTEKMYDAPYLSQGASSVDSEKQFASTGNQWKGQSNKCYSCERDMQMRCGDQCAYQATKTKCFDC